MRSTIAVIIAAATVCPPTTIACETTPTAAVAAVDQSTDPVTTGSLPRSADWRADLNRIEVAFRRTLPAVERLTDPAE